MSVYKQLITVESLPPMSATAARLMTLASDPEVEVHVLAATIEKDPALTAKVLGVANSAYYAPRQPVLTVKDAIIQVLGLRMVSSLSFGIALSGVMSNQGCDRFDLTRYWVISLGSAELAAGLARAATLADKPDPDAAYLVGLLHGIGELLLVHLWPHKMNEVLARLAERPEENRLEVERAVLGIDRWSAGAFLARHWELPAVVGDSIEQMANADQSDASPIAHLVYAARRWIEGVAMGGTDSLQVVGVDDAYCEYRSHAFLGNYEALETLAGSLHS